MLDYENGLPVQGSQHQKTYIPGLSHCECTVIGRRWPSYFMHMYLPFYWRKLVLSVLVLLSLLPTPVNLPSVNLLVAARFGVETTQLQRYLRLGFTEFLLPKAVIFTPIRSVYALSRHSSVVDCGRENANVAKGQGNVLRGNATTYFL